MGTAFAFIGPFLFSFFLLGLLHVLDWLERRLIATTGPGAQSLLVARSSTR